MLDNFQILNKIEIQEKDPVRDMGIFRDGRLIVVGINGLYIINLQNYQTEIKYQFKTKDSSRKMIELEENNLLISNSEGIDVLNYSKNEIKLIE